MCVIANSGETLVNVVKRLDTSDGLIDGEKAEYRFLLPQDKTCREYLVVDRVVLNNTMVALEKLDFYCLSYSGKFKPAHIMSLYVFNRSQWNTEYNLIKVTNSKSYVFAVYIEQDNYPFSNQPEDNAFFKYCRNIISNPDYLKSSIILPRSQLNNFRYTIFVNEVPLPGNVILRDGFYYVPLRSVCEKIGYSVTWNERRKSVEVTRGSFKHTFQFTNGVYNGNGYRIIIINDKSYATTTYLLRVLGKDVEIDESGNVYLFDS